MPQLKSSFKRRIHWNKNLAKPELLAQDPNLNHLVGPSLQISNWQLNKLKSAIKNKTEAVLRLLLNVVGDDETNFPHKLLLNNRQVANLRKAFANNLSTEIKLSKTQLSKMIQSGRFSW